MTTPESGERDRIRAAIPTAAFAIQATRPCRAVAKSSRYTTLSDTDCGQHGGGVGSTNPRRSYTADRDERRRRMSEQIADGISVFLLDDHEIFRRGLRDLLAAEPGVSVVGEASTASSALGRIPTLRPNVAILDVRLPDGDGVSVCREIRSSLPETACLMLTAYSDDHAVLDAIIAGAAGYVSKQACGEELVTALRKIASGQSVLDPQASLKVMSRLREHLTRTDPATALSEQERRVFDLIGEGLTNREIAQRMFLAEKTVKNYVSSLLTKLGMQRRTQAAALAVRRASERGI